MQQWKEYQLIILGGSILVSVLLATLIGANTLLKIKQYPNEVISVTGASTQQIHSDNAQWQGTFYRRSSNLAEAYTALKNDRVKVADHLKQLGMTPANVSFDAVNTRSILAQNDKGYTTDDVVAFELNQRVTVTSSNVNQITNLTQQISDLIAAGVDIRSEAPQYFYTKLDDLKVAMLGTATKNAYERAKSMAESTGRRVGFLRSADMGVFQITADNSTEVSDYGINDTSSVDKKVTAVVNAAFTLQ